MAVMGLVDTAARLAVRIDPAGLPAEAALAPFLLATCGARPLSLELAAGRFARVCEAASLPCRRVDAVASRIGPGAERSD